MSQVLTQVRTKKLIWTTFKMTESTQDRIDEINAEMTMLNDTFDNEKASTDFEYVKEYSARMLALSKEIMPLLIAEVE